MNEEKLVKTLKKYQNLPSIDRFTTSQALYNLIDIEVKRLLDIKYGFEGIMDVDDQLVLWEQVKRYIKGNLK